MTIGAVVFWGIVLLIGLIPIWLPIFHAWEDHREKVRNERQGYRRIRTDRRTDLDRRFLPEYTFVSDDDVRNRVDAPASATQGQHQDFAGGTGRYGEAHKALRAAWKGIIKSHGTECMEVVCILPSRRIEAGSSWDSWDLAHDHASGGVNDYLGPAHKVCNQAEALRRGVTWVGAPTLAELISSSRELSAPPKTHPKLPTHASDDGARGILAPWDDTELEDEFDPPDQRDER